MYLTTGTVYAQRKKGCIFNPFTWGYFANTFFNDIGVVVIDKEQDYVVETIAGTVVKTPLNEKLQNKKYGDDYIFFRPLFIYHPQILIAESSQIIGKSVDVTMFVYFNFIWNFFRFWKCSQDEKLAMNRIINYDILFYLHRRCMTFKNKWWKSKPSWLIGSSEFEEILIPPFIR